jgi:hypothetical protein
MVTRFLTLLLVGIALIVPGRALAQEEVTSDYYRYRDREMSTGYYEEYEVRPRDQSPFIQAPGVTRRGMRYRSDENRAWNRKFLADSHIGIPFYESRRCESCHVEQIGNMHTVREGISCRQCHSSEPIASINHYYSRMNPVRRHAYVCAKCHEGASASFATYVVHSPNPGAADTAEVFPELYYTYMALALLTLGTLAVFIPHTLLWGLRELIPRLRKRSKEHHE